MLPILNIGPLAIQTPGLIILVGTWLGLFLAERQAGRFQLNGSMLYNMAFSGLLAGVIGARATYVAHYSSAFLANPASLYSLNINMFEPVWGILIGLTTSSLYVWLKRMPHKTTVDAITSALAIIAISIHLAQFASGDAYGSAANLPWAVELWGIKRHPVQIYETLVAILILGIIWPRPGWLQNPGQRFLAFIAMSAGARVFLEAFRGDSTFWEGIRIAQVIAWLVLAASLWAIRKVVAVHEI